MPVIKSAIKKLRKDIKRTKANDAFRRELDIALRNAKKKADTKSVTNAVSLVDRAVKKNLMHKNRAGHIKSSLSKLAKPASKSKTKATPAKESAKKPAKTTTKRATLKSKTAKK